MPFQKGISGNPSGRTKGVQDRRSLLRDMISVHQEALVQKAVDLALDGNEHMLKLLLDRLLPPKPRDEPVQICLNSESYVEQSRNILSKLDAGLISAADANLLMRTVAIETKIYESEQLKNDVDKLMEHSGLACKASRL